MLDNRTNHKYLPPQPGELPPNLGCARRWGALALLAFFICAGLTQRWEQKMRLAGEGVLTRGDNPELPLTVMNRAASSRPAGGPQQFQRVEESNGKCSAEYGCLNFNNDPLRISFSITSRDLAAYNQGYGYLDSELAALSQWQKKALDEAYQHAVKNRLGQEELNKMGAAVKSEYKSKYRNFLVSRGFEFQQGNVLVADIPAIVKRNVKNLRQIALQIEGAAQKQDYDSDEIIAAVLSLVQTAIVYDNVPMVIKGRQTGGLYPPLETLARGRGDCDTKTTLLASVLLNWSKIKLVGVGIPNHYLMGVLRNPAKGDAFVEYNGLRYVLLEPAGPAWLAPGSIGTSTTALLNSGQSLTIEPISAN